MAKKKKIAPPITEIIENIVDASMDEIMGDRFGAYAKEVIQNRAIPDARDGLKPVQRRIIFAMYDEGNTFNKPTKKCAHSVGAVMGKYHPHGDSSIYEALARMSQDWVMRHPLIDFQGNNGSIDGDSPAAFRYTEARLSEIAEELIRDIKKMTVDMQLTFDDTSFEPVVLPARLPNLLINGAQGIAVGVATEIPPHNLGEVVDAIVYRINHKRATVSDLRQFVLGPDFPTGGIIYRSEGLDQMYETGRGRIEVAAKTHYESQKDVNQIIITEIPYNVNKTTILRELDGLARNKKIDGIIEMRDESDRQGLRITVDLKKEADKDIILEYILNKTSLRSGYSANMVAIDEARPKTLNLLGLVDAFINHQIDIITRRSNYELAKHQARLHLIEGLIKAISVVDDVVALIRKSKDKADAKLNLQNKYGFSPDQAEAIVTLQLYRLSNTDITILEDEKVDVNKQIGILEGILSDENKRNRVIVNDLNAIKAKYATPRRSQIEDSREVVTIDKRDLIAKEEVMIAITRDGYLKRSSVKSFRSSGDNALPGIKQGDLLIAAGPVLTTDFLLAFTSLGNYLLFPVHEIMDGKWKEEGKHINQMGALSGEEKIVQAVGVSTFRSDLFVVTLSRNGQIKRSGLDLFVTNRTARAISCMRLAKNDEVVDATVTSGNSDLIITASNGGATFFNENDLTPLSLKASGVKALGLKKAHALGLQSYHPEEKGKLIALSKEGHFRIVDINYFLLTPRLGKQQVIYKTFKSDPHQLIYFNKLEKGKDKVTLNLLTDTNQIIPLVIDDFKPTPLEKYAKANIEALPALTQIVGVYDDTLQVVTDKTKAFIPPVVVEETKVKDQPIEDENEYEQISIFDVMGD